MNTAHRPAIFETRFAEDYPIWQPARPSVWPRVFHFIASAVVVTAFICVVVGAVSGAIR